MNEKKHDQDLTLLKAAFLSLCLAIAKLVAFFMSGSLLVLGSFFDSLADTVSSMINHRVFNLSRERPDREHPFGHGGFEVIAGLSQGLVILLLAGFLGFEVGHKAWDYPNIDMSDDGILVAIVVLTLGALFGWMVHNYIARALDRIEAANQRSISMFADKQHYAGDAWANALGAVGLILVYFLNAPWLDVLFGGITAIALVLSAYPILKKSIGDVVNLEAPPLQQQQIVDIVLASDSRIHGIHALRTRQMGPVLFIDFHLKLSRKMSLETAHSIGDVAERHICDRFVDANVLVHLDPDSEPDQQDWSPSYELPRSSD